MSLFEISVDKNEKVVLLKLHLYSINN